MNYTRVSGNIHALGIADARGRDGDYEKKEPPGITFSNAGIDFSPSC
jgi:hypothetical protein